MEVLEAIKTRRSIRRFRSDPVPEEVLGQILDAGRWAPSAKNSQSWKFIVIKDLKVITDVAEVLRWGRFLPQAPVTVAVVVDPRLTPHPMEDGTLAAYSMLLAVHALGLGGCWVDPSYREEIIAPMLGISGEEKLICLIPIGYADEAPVTPRKELKDVVFINRLRA